MSWLPGGRLLYNHRGTLHVVDVASGKDQPLAVRGPKPMPIFTTSSDGRWLAYQTSTPESGVDMAVASIPEGEGRWLVRSPKEDYHASGTAAGTWLYFQMDHRNVWRVPGPAQGWRPAPPQQVTFVNEPGLFLEDPQVSADGRRLFYSKIRTEGDLWVVDLPSEHAPDNP